jgi:hypothetical protein
MPHRFLAALLSACTLASAAAGGCAGADLAAESRRVRGLLRDARARGAERCSPAEIALAERHVAFAERKLEEGERGHARDHVVIADRHARRALALSPPDRCALTAAVAGGLAGRARGTDLDVRGIASYEATGLTHTAAARNDTVRAAIAITQP